GFAYGIWLAIRTGNGYTIFSLRNSTEGSNTEHRSGSGIWSRKHSRPESTFIRRRFLNRAMLILLFQAQSSFFRNASPGCQAYLWPRPFSVPSSNWNSRYRRTLISVCCFVTTDCAQWLL